MRWPSLYCPRFLSNSTRSNRLSTLRFFPIVPVALKLRCCDIIQNPVQILILIFRLILIRLVAPASKQRPYLPCRPPFANPLFCSLLFLELFYTLVNGREKAVAADLGGEAGACEQPAQGRIGVGDLEGDTLALEFLVQIAQGLERRHVNVGDSLGIEQEPAWRRWAGGDELAHALDEIAGIAEKQRRIEPVNEQAGQGLVADALAEVVKAVAGDLGQC